MSNDCAIIIISILSFTLCFSIVYCEKIRFIEKEWKKKWPVETGQKRLKPNRQIEFSSHAKLYYVSAETSCCTQLATMGAHKYVKSAESYASTMAYGRCNTFVCKHWIVTIKRGLRRTHTYIPMQSHSKTQTFDVSLIHIHSASSRDHITV